MKTGWCSVLELKVSDPTTNSNVSLPLKESFSYNTKDKEKHSGFVFPRRLQD